MTSIESLFPQMHRIRKASVGIGAAALVCGIAAAFFNPPQFFRSYLIGYVFLLGTTLGSMGLVMLYHLTSGYWGLIMRRVMESASRVLPLMAVLMIPLFFGMRYLYEWPHASAVHADPLLQAKQFYLTMPFFLVRQAVYFAVWLGLVYFLNRWSARQDSTDDPEILRKLRAVSGPGMVVYALTVTFAAVDWLMSLEPHFYSTTFGFRLLTGQAVNALSFGILVTLLLSGRGPVESLIDHKRLRDLGNMLLAAIMLWAYIAFTEYLIIWAGDIPHETVWFRQRFWQGWGVLAWFLLVFHFFIPFFLLLQRSVKHRPWFLAGIAAWLLLMRLTELFWMVEPSRNAGFHLHWMDVVIPLGLSGIWLSVFIWQLGKKPLMPLYDPLYMEHADEQPAIPLG